VTTTDYTGLAIPTTPPDAAAAFRCAVHACRMQGASCAAQHRRGVTELRGADVGTEAEMRWRACGRCPAGAARASLLTAPSPPTPRPMRSREGAGLTHATVRASSMGQHRRDEFEAALVDLVAMLARPMTREAAADAQGVAVSCAGRRLRTLVDRGLALRVAGEARCWRYGSTAVHGTEAGLAASVQEAP